MSRGGKGGRGKKEGERERKERARDGGKEEKERRKKRREEGMNVGENAEGRSGCQNKEERAGGGDEEVGVRRTPPAPSLPQPVQARAQT